ncbi:ABC transporter ATP-binding protein [Aureimonas phyllosphaerae]|uniref:Peptide/nickel transport system ATP-binding protein n=1 Tax=Aureimonas phyllosphaerae TaxID=1166078 RepID=A0A7W6BSJ8_9HYPH|nr:ABC transporter ATP-binding protein [Aureimonas phyllosphaerae]MBB3934243.1 peptide/nickel transport system ATP-binding protein [Aureimonas phyllosphaerae]MBB3958541.1 peptide/nickel transport system ATP-binding protein [Aureimonas phyllosphaerae]SFE98580.1 peptide/nickel transport system ATP-binding protein [Aureimonas phyllosphaerae]
MHSPPQPLLSVRDLRTWFHTFAGTVKAVNGVSFDLAAGEIMGLVGESGGGKSVVGFSLLGLIDPPGRIEGGEILFGGEDLAKASEKRLRQIRGREIAMIFQDPMTSLNPVQTIGRQMDEMLRLHTDLDKAARRARCIEMLEANGISRAAERLDSYPHQFSGGMRQRVVIAIALLAKPRLIIADEPTTALDVTIQAQILRLMRREIRDQGASLILVTHDLAVVAEMVDKVTVLYCGRVVETGPVRQILEAPAHPYTRGLIDSIPDPDHRQPRLRQIPGTVPDVRHLPKGCAFRARCPRAQALCASVEPELTPQPGGGLAACHFPLSAGGTA